MRFGVRIAYKSVYIYIYFYADENNLTYSVNS